jgi:hypothetical protein
MVAPSAVALTARCAKENYYGCWREEKNRQTYKSNALTWIKPDVLSESMVDSVVGDEPPKSARGKKVACPRTFAEEP